MFPVEHITRLASTTRGAILLALLAIAAHVGALVLVGVP